MVSHFLDFIYSFSEIKTNRIIRFRYEIRVVNEAESSKKKKKSKLCGNPSMESIYEKSTKWEKQLILIFNSLPCLLVIFII